MIRRERVFSLGSEAFASFRLKKHTAGISAKETAQTLSPAL
jgi:hypothetical protein